MCFFAISIIYRICIIQFVEGNYWREKAKAYTTKIEDMEAVRGNIFDANGALLATSLPFYEIAMDINAPSITDKSFNNNRDSLAYLLNNLFQDKSTKEYINILIKSRNKKERYVLLKRNVSFKELQILKTFPLFRKGKLGGLITIQNNRRELPFQNLASRTIGKSRPGLKPIGLEGAFDSVLMGVSGTRLMQKIAGNVWRPINNENEVEPKDGSDLYTTIDINIQDVAEHALKKALIKNKAAFGCVVLMEVKTGAIKAIANLTKVKGDSSNYIEDYNYAIGHSSEPGSTFKLASFLSVIDNNEINLQDKINVGNGECMYFNKKMKDSHPPKKSVMSIQEIFENSSNVGTSKLVMKYFSNKQSDFTNKLRSFHLHEKLNLAIPGEGISKIKQVKDNDWYGTSLPWISIGYESNVTPLQTLTFYNAIANDGRMVKPRFISEIKRNGITVKKFNTEVIDEKIIKASTIVKAKQLLEGVVKNGSGRGININAFKVGGKTGTAQILKNGKYKADGLSSYQASFVGYFPADKPLYSCIVVIYEPSTGVYGGIVAAPVFKEIAEKVYSSSFNCLEPINNKNQIISKYPYFITSISSELTHVANLFSLPVQTSESIKYVRQNLNDSIKINFNELNFDTQLKKGVMPNLQGLSAKDALFLLENNGLSVKILGFGSVKKQSIEAGQRFNKGYTITLTLI